MEEMASVAKNEYSFVLLRKRSQQQGDFQVETAQYCRSLPAFCPRHLGWWPRKGVGGGWVRLGIVGHLRRLRRRCAVGGLLGDGSCPGRWTSPRRCAWLVLKEGCQVREARAEPGVAFRHRHRRTQGLTSRGGEGRPSSSGLQGVNRIFGGVRGGVCRRNPALLLVGSRRCNW